MRCAVHEILRPPHIVARKNLECNQVARARDADRKVGQQLNLLGLAHDLGLDSRRSEQQVDDRPSGLA